MKDRVEKDGVEAGARRVRRTGQIQTALMTALLVGGMMAIGAAPRIDLLKLIGQKKRNPYRFKHQINDALRRLALKGFVVFEAKGVRRFARLTPSGKRHLEYEQQKALLNLEHKKRWDKRWRVIIFDIPEYRRNTRDQLRVTMQNSGFYRLQNSVWLYPYDCEDFVTLLKADLHVGSAVLYMVVEKIENDQKIKDFFTLD